MLLDDSGEIANKLKVKTAYDTAGQMQKAAIMQMMIELLPLQTTLDGKIKPPPNIAPKQCLLLAEKCIDAWLRLCYKTDGKAVLTLPQNIGNKETDVTAQETNSTQNAIQD